MTKQDELISLVVDKLTGVIDPETGVDVVHMKLVQEIKISDNGKISYIFRPSSPLCPLAAPLALDIIQAINGIHEITSQQIKVIDYVNADQLNAMLQSLLEGDEHGVESDDNKS